MHFLGNLEDSQNGDGLVQPANRADKRSRLAKVADGDLFIRMLIRLRSAITLGLGSTHLHIGFVGFVSHVICAVVERSPSTVAIPAARLGFRAFFFDRSSLR